MNKLARRLRREAMANPKKALILAGLSLVALYFWGPLVWGWARSGHTSANVAAGKAKPPELAPDGASGGAAKPGESPVELIPSYAWTQLDEWMSQDPLRSPVDTLSGRRNPFAPLLVVADTAASEQPEPEPDVEVAKATPETLGLTLNGTLVGPRRRVALIGGKAYREGQTVRVDRDGRSIELKLVEVHARRIVLEWQGSSFELAIPEHQPAGIELTVHNDGA
jgi:hypothetical protein